MNKEVDAAPVPVNVLAEVLRPAGVTKVVANWDRDYFKGAPACTEKASGRGMGKAVYFGSFVNLEAARALLARYAAERGVRPLFAGFPEEVEVTRRTRGADEFYFILNHASAEVRVSPGTGFFDLIDGGPAAETLALPPYGYKVLRHTKR